MMTDEITAMLKGKDQPDNIITLRNDIRQWLRLSRRVMRKNYGRWDYNMRTFRTHRTPENNDRDAIREGEPTKMTVPMSYTQVMTYVTFAFMLMKQNDVFFELDGNQNDAYGMTEASEDMLENDLRANFFDTKLVQSLLDAARMGLCAFKCTWKVENVMVNVPSGGTQVNGDSFNEVTAPTVTAQSVIKYEGNSIHNISPYRLLPDMRFPLSRWREGRFVADEYEYSISYLKDLEQQGVIAGTEWVDRTSRELFTEGSQGGRYGEWDINRFELVQTFLDKDNKQNNSNDDFMCISSEGHFKIIPKNYGLGPEDYLCDYIIQMVNDERVVRIERIEYMHYDFIYDIGQFIPDEHAKLNQALIDPISAIQEVITFLINSRVISLRQGLERHLIYDPSVIDPVAIEGRSPAIPLLKGSPRNGLQNYIMQLRYQDPTMNNLQEAEGFQKILQLVTGVNENAMGQYAPGRRSATENKAANQGAASRMTFHTSMLWSQCYGPLGAKMLSNSRQGVSLNTFLKVIGTQAPTPGTGIQSLYAQYAPQDKTTLIGNNAFFVFNGTSASERTFLAQTLQELVMALMQNPQMMPLLGYNPTSLIDEIQRLRGVRNVSRFKTAPGANPIQNPAALAAVQALNAAAPGNGAGAPQPGQQPPVAAAGAGVPGST